ncbi:MAG TPA: hypothetical protein VL985_11570 [Stellaceae bacterium]|nr:hypothetical protein [Stellaceae bacterium]
MKLDQTIEMAYPETGILLFYWANSTVIRAEVGFVRGAAQP